MGKDEIKRILAGLEDERNGALLYRVMAEVEKDQRIAEIYRRFEAVEQKHAEAWIRRLTEAGVPIPPFGPSMRTRVFSWIARRFGPGAILSSVVGMERTAVLSYTAKDGPGGPAPDEASHARLLEEILKSPSGGMQGRDVAVAEGRHKSGGLVSNLALVMGVAGADLAGNSILVTGLAGLLAGASSMALGEWLSVQSSRELYARQIAIEKTEIESAPEEEAEELALIYQSRGLGQEEARRMAHRIMDDKAGALQTLAREELGIDPEDLGGSAWVAAGTSFCLFAVGAVLPVLPFALTGGHMAVGSSIGLSALGLLLIGAATSLFTGRSMAFSGARMVIFGLAAAAITFTIGRLIGVSLMG